MAETPETTMPERGHSDDLEAELRRAVGGEVRFDAYTRHMYATDASMYQITPVGVVAPRDADDVAAVVETARRFRTPVLPRGAGTSHCGQTVGEAVVLDFSRHMNRVLEISPEERRARVHVRTKDELVALMDDAIMGEVLIPGGEVPTDWYEALAAVAERTRDVLIRHPWAPQSLQNALPGPNAMRHFEQSLAALADTALAADAKFGLIAAVDDYVHGSALRAAESYAAAGDAPCGEWTGAAARFAEAQLATGAFPHTRDLLGGTDHRSAAQRLTGGATERERFRDGLAMLLAGAAARLGLRLPE
ncbi:FAD-binding protein [Streptomonospora wellingtoniae]|uniref:TetR/AcrR family transcriptional regulator C-terminal domain-containing protein n=1 Tax=Streptomonospora wellingtoniae TaxID=3075544 RepID=A0ABU2L0W8_9ACTN|nr:FAD-binding protein [Streptomonospora sp. DSM 45055]MDT0305175.1 TetR/AcrR family transcriptional regulator C-terminal domain-containing protein [Streptomonospora sp. DSM 45055]